MNIPHHDVAITGFGPCGAVAAVLLGKMGLRVLVVERSHTIYDKPRAVAMDHEIMRVLQGCDVGSAVAPHTAPFTLSERIGADGQLLRRVGMLPPPYPLAWAPTMAFHQPQVEGILRARVAELPCVEVRLGLELTALSQDGEGVTLSLQGEDGVMQSARARYVIGCDGASSTVRRLLGIGVDDLGFNEPWLVIDLLANDKGLAHLPKVSTHFCDPARPAMFVVCTGRHRRFEIMLKPGEIPQDMERAEAVWDVLSPWVARDEAELWRRASYCFRALVAKQWRVDRVFLAGDAAHQQPPFLGQGWCQGVRDVCNLAWKLQQVLAGEAGEALLDTYFAERSTHVRELTHTILGMGRFLCELDPVAARARDAQLLAEAGGEIRTVLRQDLIPGLRAGMLSSREHAAHGTLFPQPWVRDGGTIARMDDAAGSGWRVVLGDAALSWQPQARPPMRVLRVAAAPGTEAGTECWAETEGVLAGWFARHGAAAAIVRPDHYVYAVAASARVLQDELDALPAAAAGAPAPAWQVASGHAGLRALGT